MEVVYKCGFYMLSLIEHLLRNNMLDELKHCFNDGNYREGFLLLYGFDTTINSL
jgi:hypothetical protein